MSKQLENYAGYLLLGFVAMVLIWSMLLKPIFDWIKTNWIALSIALACLIGASVFFGLKYFKVQNASVLRNEEEKLKFKNQRILEIKAENRLKWDAENRTEEDRSALAEKAFRDEQQKEESIHSSNKFHFGINKSFLSDSEKKMPRVLGERDKKILYNRAKGICENPYCKRKIAYDEMQAGHKIAACHGGLATLANSVCICWRCNNNQGTDDWSVFLKKQKPLK